MRELNTSERIDNVQNVLFLAQGKIYSYVVQEIGTAGYEALKGIIPALIVSLAFVTLTTAVGAGAGAAVGSLGFGLGAVPLGIAGGSLGFQTGLWVLNLVGLAFLIDHMGSSLQEAVRHIENGFARAWGPRSATDLYSCHDGDLSKAANEIALGVAVIIRCILEGLVLYLTAKGISKLPELVANLKRSKLGEGFAVWVEQNYQQLLNNPRFTMRTGTGATADKPTRILEGSNVAEVPRPRIEADQINRTLPEGMKGTDNKSILEWYNQQTNPQKINSLNEQWKNEGIHIHERAERIYKLRHDARLTAREYMRSPDEVAALRQRDLVRHGSPDGPTFPQEVEKYRSQGLKGDEIYQAIIDGASRTSPEYNAKFGIQR
jgi:hypothetical protein